MKKDRIVSAETTSQARQVRSGFTEGDIFFDDDKKVRLRRSLLDCCPQDAVDKLIDAAQFVVAEYRTRGRSKPVVIRNKHEKILKSAISLYEALRDLSIDERVMLFRRAKIIVNDSQAAVSAIPMIMQILPVFAAASEDIATEIMASKAQQPEAIRCVSKLAIIWQEMTLQKPTFSQNVDETTGERRKTTFEIFASEALSPDQIGARIFRDAIMLVTT